MSFNNFHQKSNKETDYRCWQELFSRERYCIMQSLWTSALHKLLPYETLIRMENWRIWKQSTFLLSNPWCPVWRARAIPMWWKCRRMWGSHGLIRGGHIFWGVLGWKLHIAQAEPTEGRCLLSVEVWEPVNELNQGKPDLNETGMAFQW